MCNYRYLLNSYRLCVIRRSLFKLSRISFQFSTVFCVALYFVAVWCYRSITRDIANHRFTVAYTTAPSIEDKDFVAYNMEMRPPSRLWNSEYWQFIYYILSYSLYISHHATRSRYRTGFLSFIRIKIQFQMWFQFVSKIAKIQFISRKQLMANKT